jgi:hypothetical protein
MISLKTRLDPWCARLLAIVAAAPLLHCGGSTIGSDDDGGGPNLGADGGSAGKNGSGATTGAGTTGSGGFVSTGAGGDAGGIAAGGVGAVSGSGGVAGEGGSGGSAGTAGGAGQGGEGGFPCENPTHLEGVDGYEQCDGFKHRPEVVTCTSLLPRPTDWTPDDGDLCEADTDCTERPHGYCSPNGGQGDPGGLPVRVCHYGCTVDADCGAGSICLCGPVIGACVTSSCTSDAQCGDGLLCASVFNNICMESGFACQHPDDECASGLDCPSANCVLESDGVRRCAAQECAVVGRPFLIDDAARLAVEAARADWTSSEVELDARGLGAAERAALGAAWLRNALMEHASVAAFARFTLELLAVGAPADLIRDSNSAASDETRHAELCFALASEYLGEPVGPGSLRIDGALDGITLEKLVVTTIAEGCVGETIAAIEAAEQLAHASDPAVKGVLSRISEDETRHAELAWRFVAWALEQQPSLREVAEREFERHLSTPVSFSDDSELDLGRFGVLSGSTRAELRRRVLDRVVRPSAALLLARVHPADTLLRASA